MLFLLIQRLAALPDSERREYVRAQLAKLDTSTEQTIAAALPAQSARAARLLLVCLREWS